MKVLISLVTSKLGVGKMACRALLHNERYKTCNGWYSGMVAPIYSIVGAHIHVKNGWSNSSGIFSKFRLLLKVDQFE